MDERTAVRAQIAALLDQLDHAEQVIGAEHLPQELREAVEARFAMLIENHRTELRGLQVRVDKKIGAGRWWENLREYRKESEALFDECLAFLGGVMVRSSRLDGGFCEIADAVNKDLNGRTGFEWNRLTILARGEMFTEMSEMVRLRFPELTIWSLPIAVHEYGHFVERRGVDPGGRLAFQALIDDESKQPGVPRSSASSTTEGGAPATTEPRSHLSAYFADLFAIFALGPAYACSCMLLRFDPHREVDTDSQSHPSDAKRAHFMLEALSRLDPGNDFLLPVYAPQVQPLRDAWGKSRLAAGQPPDVPPQVELRLKARLGRWIPKLSAGLPPKARYGGWSRVPRLALALAEANTATSIVEADDSLLDVINAAWKWRVDTWGEHDERDVARISQRALSACETIVARDR